MSYPVLLKSVMKRTAELLGRKVSNRPTNRRRIEVPSANTIPPNRLLLRVQVRVPSHRGGSSKTPMTIRSEASHV